MLQCLLDMMMTADCFSVLSTRKGSHAPCKVLQKLTYHRMCLRYRTDMRTQNNALSYTEVNGCVYSLAEGLSEWTGGVEGTKLGKKKERSEWSEWRGERWVGKFSQLPATLLWIFRFNGLFFFFVLQREFEKKKNKWAQNKTRSQCLQCFIWFPNKHLHIKLYHDRFSFKTQHK